MNEVLQTNLLVILIIGLLSFIIVQTLINIKQKKRLEVYQKTLENIEEYDNVEDAFKNLYKKMEQTNDFCDATKQICEDIDYKVQRCIQKVGIVKYSTHDTGRNELSFAIAMLDNNDDGIILNEVHTRTASNIYAKQIEKGISSSRLSDEEARALNKALKDKEFVKRDKI